MIFIYMIYGFMGIMMLVLLIGCSIGIIRTCVQEIPEVPPDQSKPKELPEIITIVIQPDQKSLALGRHQVRG
jgi:hypothetical protein